MLRDALDESIETAATLRERLRFRERESGKLIDSGSISSAATAGSSVSYATPGPGAMTTTDAAKAACILLETFDLCQAALIASGVSQPTDTEIYNQMLLADDLNSVEHFGIIRPDFSWPRY